MYKNNYLLSKREKAVKMNCSNIPFISGQKATIKSIHPEKHTVGFLIMNIGLIFKSCFYTLKLVEFIELMIPWIIVLLSTFSC